MEFDGVDRLLPCPYSLGMCQAIAVWKSNLPLPLIDSITSTGGLTNGVAWKRKFASPSAIGRESCRSSGTGSCVSSAGVLPTGVADYHNRMDVAQQRGLREVERPQTRTGRHPSLHGLESGVWFKITQGIRGLLVHDETGTPTVYMICETSTRYYRVMTRCERMPVLIGEVI